MRRSGNPLDHDEHGELASLIAAVARVPADDLHVSDHYPDYANDAHVFVLGDGNAVRVSNIELERTLPKPKDPLTEAVKAAAVAKHEHRKRYERCRCPERSANFHTDPNCPAVST